MDAFEYHCCCLSGEIVPEHLLTILTDMLRENAEAEAEAATREAALAMRVAAAHAQAQKGSPGSLGLVGELESETGSMPPTLQTKRIPFDALRISTDEHSMSRWTNEAGRRRQQVGPGSVRWMKSAN